MSELPPLPRDQRKIDADHLNLLAIFHFVGAGLAVLGLLFLLVHYTFMHAMFTNPKFFENQKQPMPMTPEQLFAIFKWFYLGRVEPDFRPVSPRPEGPDIFAGGGGHQLPAHPAGHGAGRVHDSCPDSRFRP